LSVFQLKSSLHFEIRSFPVLQQTVSEHRTKSCYFRCFCCCLCSPVNWDAVFRHRGLEKFAVHTGMCRHVGVLRLFPGITEMTVSMWELGKYENRGQCVNIVHLPILQGVSIALLCKPCTGYTIWMSVCQSVCQSVRLSVTR